MAPNEGSAPLLPDQTTSLFSRRPLSSAATSNGDLSHAALDAQVLTRLLSAAASIHHILKPLPKHD